MDNIHFAGSRVEKFILIEQIKYDLTWARQCRNSIVGGDINVEALADIINSHTDITPDQITLQHYEIISYSIEKLRLSGLVAADNGQG